MANKNLQIVINAKDNATKNFKKLTNEMKKTGSSANNLNSTFGKLVGTTHGLGAMRLATALGGLYALRIAMKKTVGAAIDYESAFAGVRKTIDATEPQFKMLSDNFRMMAKQIPVSVNELAKIGELAGQLGVPIGAVTTFTETIAKLGVTTNLTTESAAMQFSRFANIVQMPIKEVDKLGAVIVDLGNNFATTEAEIMTFSLRIAAAGKMAGFNEAEIMGIGAAFSSVGIQAEMGGSAFMRVISDMSEATALGTDNLKVYAQVAGMSADEFAKVWKEDASQAFSKFITGLGTSGDLAFQVFDDLSTNSIRVKHAFLSLAGAGDLITDSFDTANNAFIENIALNVEAAKRFETTQSKIEIFKNSLYDVGITIGDIVLPAISALLDAINEMSVRSVAIIKMLITAFKILGKSIDTIFTMAFKGVIISFKKVGNFIIKGINGIKKIIGSEPISFEFDTQKTIDSMNVVGFMINDVGNEINNLKNNFKSGSDSSSLMYHKIRDSQEMIKKAINETGEEYKSAADKGNQATNKLSQSWDKYKDKVLDVNDKVKNSLTTVTKQIKNLQSEMEQLLVGNVKENLSVNQSYAEEYVNQEQKIADIQKQINEETDFAKRESLKNKLDYEKSELERHSTILIAHENEINEVRRRNSLSDITRAVEDLNKKRILINQEFQFKFNQINKELELEENKQSKLLELQKYAVNITDKFLAQQEIQTIESINRQIKVYNDLAKAIAAARQGQMSGYSGLAGGTQERASQTIPTVNITIQGDVSGEDLINKVKSGIMGDLALNNNL